jgi:hypothetical protein
MNYWIITQRVDKNSHKKSNITNFSYLIARKAQFLNWLLFKYIKHITQDKITISWIKWKWKTISYVVIIISLVIKVSEKIVLEVEKLCKNMASIVIIIHLLLEGEVCSFSCKVLYKCQRLLKFNWLWSFVNLSWKLRDISIRNSRLLPSLHPSNQQHLTPY